MDLKKLLGAVLIAFSISPCANADIVNTTASIVRVLVTGDDAFGGCMVKLSKSLGGICTPWAAMSCTGVHNPKDQAARLFDNALMAYALDKQVAVFAEDSQTHDGHCVVKRLDVL